MKGISLPSGNNMKNVDEKAHSKYLGIPLTEIIKLMLTSILKLKEKVKGHRYTAGLDNRLDSSRDISS